MRATSLGVYVEYKQDTRKRVTLAAVYAEYMRNQRQRVTALGVYAEYLQRLYISSLGAYAEYKNDPRQRVTGLGVYAEYLPDRRIHVEAFGIYLEYLEAAPGVPLHVAIYDIDTYDDSAYYDLIATDFTVAARAPQPVRPVMGEAVKAIGRGEQAPPKQDVDEIILGRRAGSMLEAVVAAALQRLGLGFAYQVPVNGGNRLRGGTVIDFLVYVAPMPVPLYAHGDYWHGDQKKQEADRLMMSNVRRWMNYEVDEPRVIWEHEAQTVEQAVASLRRILRL